MPGCRPREWSTITSYAASVATPNLNCSQIWLSLPVTKAGCPIQARFWLEWESARLPGNFLYCNRSPGVSGRGPVDPTQAKTGLEWGTQPLLPVERAKSVSNSG